MFGESSQGELSQGGDDGQGSGQGGGVVGGVGCRANHLFRELNPSGNVTNIYFAFFTKKIDLFDFKYLRNR